MTVRNVITSMRLISAVEWADFFESVSLVEEALRQGTRVAEMDFATRDQYRRAVESSRAAAGSMRWIVALRAVSMAAQCRGQACPRGGDHPPVGSRVLPGRRGPGSPREGDRLPPGARRSLPARLAPERRGRLHRDDRVSHARNPRGSRGARALARAERAGVVAARAAGRRPGFRPRRCLRQPGRRRARPAAAAPKLEIQEGIPAELRTLVAVPTLLASEADIQRLIERLECTSSPRPAATSPSRSSGLVRRRRRDPAGGRTPPRGRGRRHLAAERRSRPGPGGGPRFLLLHRRRAWNEKEGKWIGWERKRGKLEELNRLLRGATDTTFLPLPQAAGRFRRGPLRHHARRGHAPSARRGAEARRRDGASAELPGLRRARLARRERPRDPPAARDADAADRRIRHDLPAGLLGPARNRPVRLRRLRRLPGPLRRGIYTGKGIYDVDAFARAHGGAGAGRTRSCQPRPLRGTLRARGPRLRPRALRGFPAHYGVGGDAHRTAGSAATGSCSRGSSRRSRRRRHAGENPISALGRWKIARQPRRSLSPPPRSPRCSPRGCSAPRDAWLWTAFIRRDDLRPEPLSPSPESCSPRAGAGSPRGATSGAWRRIWRLASPGGASRRLPRRPGRADDRRDRRARSRASSSRGGGCSSGLPRARRSGGLDLALRAPAPHGVRRGLRRRRLLPSPRSVPLAPGVPAAGRVGRLAGRGEVGQPSAARRGKRSPWRKTTGSPARRRPEDLALLRDFPGPADNFLPPDNFQQDPEPVVAHRTSPTNIGLGLLSAVCAADLGWIGVEDARPPGGGVRSDRARRALPRPSLQLVRDDDAASRSSRGTSRRWTAATSPGDLIALSTPAWNGSPRPREWPDRRATASRTRWRFGETLGQPRAVLEARGRYERQLSEALRASGRRWIRRPPPPPSGPRGCRVLARGGDARRHRAGARRGPAGRCRSRGGGRLGPRVRARASTSHARDFDGDPLLAGRSPAGRRAWRRWRRRSSPGRSQRRARERRRPPGSAGPTRPRPGRGRRERQAPPARRDRAPGGLARRRDGLLLSLRPPAQALLDRLQPLRTGGSIQATTTCSPPEARLASFIAIAEGDVPAAHWFRLGRALTPVGSRLGARLLVGLDVRVPDAGAADAKAGRKPARADEPADRARRQIGYGEERGVPWGVSESAFNARDLHHTYQYSNFGVAASG